MFRFFIKKYLESKDFVLLTKDQVEDNKKKSSYNYYIESQKYLESAEFRYVLWLDRIYQKIKNVPGHIVELGVAYGRNSILFGHQIKMNGDDLVRKYYGFDTFSGYTQESLKLEPNLSDATWKDKSKGWVEDKIKRVGLDELCFLIEGDVVKTVPAFLESKPNFRAALLYVDCNSYTPSIEGMRAMKKFMSPGGVICIDEKRQGGETKALIEFCQENNLRFMKDDSPFAIPSYTQFEY